MTQMRANLANLLGLNQKLISNAGIVGSQKDKLAAELKKVKVMIGKAGNLRCRRASPRRREQNQGCKPVQTGHRR